MEIPFFKSTTFWNIILVISVFFSVFMAPLFYEDWGIFLVRTGFTIMYLSAIFSLEKRPVYILIISVVAFLLEWISGLFQLTIIMYASKYINVLFFLVVVFLLIRQIATSRIVNAKTILGSISGYLLIGLMYSVLVAMIMQHDPGAYNIPSSSLPVSRDIHLSESLYYGFITLATVGYGDIVPLKPYSRSLSTFIAISGQLYIAIIIALLVGKFASRNYNEEK